MEDSKSENSKSYKESIPLSPSSSAWHWLVIIGTALGIVIDGLIPHSFGTFIANFQLPVHDYLNSSVYHASQFQLDWIPAVSSAFPCIFLPLFTILIERVNISYQLLSGLSFVIISISCGLSSLVDSWPILMITYSILYSVGSSLFLSITIILSAEYFPIKHDYYVLATSLYQIGYPIACLIGNPLMAFFIINYGWQNAFKYVAYVDIIFGLVISCFMKPLYNEGIFKCCSNESHTVKSHEEEIGINQSNAKSIWEFMKTRYEIWPWFLGKYINYMCWYGLRTNIVTYLVRSTDFGLSRSSILMSVYSSLEIIAALVASLSGDKFRKLLIHIHIAAAISLAILTGIYPYVLINYVAAIFLMIGIGISIQLSLSFGYPATVEVWNSELDTKTGWVLTNIAAGLGILTSPLFSGILMDIFGIKFLFYAQVCGWIFQSLLFTLTLIMMKYSRRNSLATYEEIKS